MGTAGQKNGKKPRIFFLFSLLGPGLLAALADNDAGGVISYAVTGAKFGLGLFIPLTCCLVFVTYTVQEMAMRLGVVSAEGYSTLVPKRYGRVWMGYQLISLLAENFLTLLTEFMGMSAGLMVLGLPMWASVLIGLGLVLSLSLYHGYAAKERMAIVIGCLNFVFIVVAFLVQPDFSAVAQAFVSWGVPQGEEGDVAWYLIALVGNAIAPWMIFYQNSAYMDKGTTTGELRRGRADTLIGCIFQVVVAVFILLIGASLFGQIAGLEDLGPADFIRILQEKFGFLAALLFGLGLFNAGLLASITVSLSSSWSVAQAFGWSKSLNDTITQAPKFYAIYFASVVSAAGVVLIPGLPLNHVAVLTQVLGGILMAPILIFLALLTSSREVMGQYRNRGWIKVRAWIVVGLLGAVSLAAMGIGLFGG